MSCTVREVISRLLTGCVVFAALSGCAQMTKHSNTMIFATDTGIGLKVGQDANQMPAIEIGYSRQETALVPLLANTDVDANGELQPCPAGTTAEGNSIDVEDCHFRASHDGQDRDSYSTMASFGTKVRGSTQDATMAVAQFFATGIAAQNLTLAGGANLVQVSGDPAVAKANGDAAKAASTALALEKANAIEVQAATDNGVLAAKTILGKSGDAVSEEALAALAAKIATADPDMPACSVQGLNSLDRSSVEKFLEAMSTTRRPCLRALSNAVDQ